MNKIIDEYSTGLKTEYCGNTYELFDWHTGARYFIISSAYKTDDFIIGSEFVHSYVVHKGSQSVDPNYYYKKIEPQLLSDIYWLVYSFRYANIPVGVSIENSQAVRLTIDADRCNNSEREMLIALGFQSCWYGEHSWDYRESLVKSHVQITDHNFEVAYCKDYPIKMAAPLDVIKRKHKDLKCVLSVDAKSIFIFLIKEKYKNIEFKEDYVYSCP